jgi:tripartite-type tricarboxylate transporter receptor subunit TctC
MMRIYCLAIAFLAAVSPSGAAAQDYPSRTVTLVVPYAAGGGTDILARALAQKFSERFGKPFVVDNRPGGGTVIAAQSVAKAAPDGHTLIFAPSGMLTINPTLYNSLPYDAAKDFVPVALVSNVPFVLVVTPSLPVRSVADLIRYGKGKPPGSLAYASPGTGTMGHLAGELLKQMTGLDITPVPYKGNMPALTDVVAGHVQLTFTDPAISPPMIREGKLRALGVTSLKRAGALPDVPPLAETGLPGFEAISWHMIMAPAGTPQPVVDRLHAELKSILALASVEDQITRIGLIPVATPSVVELRAFVAAEMDRWGKLVHQVGIAGTE